MYYYLMYWHSKCYIETNETLIVVWSVSINLLLWYDTAESLSVSVVCYMSILQYCIKWHNYGAWSDSNNI